MVSISSIASYPHLKREQIEGRILGLDLGEKRIGLAVSDPLGLTAQGLPTLEVASEKEALERIAGAAREWEAARIVVGLPLNMNGSEGAQAARARRVGAALGRALSLPVDFRDERWSSRSAERILLEADLSRGKRRKALDRLSAQIILQSYLDSRAKPVNGQG